MLSDIEIIDIYFGGGLPSDQAFEAWQRIKSLVEAQNTAHNPARDEICADIIESDDLCDYCKNDEECYGSCQIGSSNFVGRKLRPC